MDNFNRAGLLETGSPQVADTANAQFYQRFPYPWPPMKFAYLSDPHFETVMLNQGIGDWQQSTIPPGPRIWVAGCGTNQAIFTALRFPEGHILGTDLSCSALDSSAAIAKELGITNLTLKEESINQSTYQSEFDYILCTGVIHHNADPAQSLQKIAHALAPDGVLELMVYNEYHRVTIRAFQKAIGLLCSSTTHERHFEQELAIAKALVHTVPTESSLYDTLQEYQDCPEPMLADTLLQPIEHYYTVESMQALALTCGLRLQAPCINAFDKAGNTFAWNMDFADPALQHRYDQLADAQRWQITNYLKLNQSPMLWFYLQRTTCKRNQKTEREMCEEFLATKFVRASTTQKSFVCASDGKYERSDREYVFPAIPEERSLRRVYEHFDAEKTMGENLKQMGIKTTFPVANQFRLKLTTPLFPYFRAIA